MVPSVEFPNVDQMTGDGGRGRHRRTDEVGAAATSLPSLEVPVAGRGAPFARPKDVRIHAEAHRAAGVAPLEAGFAKQRIETLRLGLPLHARRPRHDHSAHLRMYAVTADN